jgi:hypothetical protein
MVNEIASQIPIEAIAHAFAEDSTSLSALSPTTHVALRDPYLREQIAELHRHWEVRPTPQGIVGRIRTRLAWWLLGQELVQANRAHATMVRIIDSLVVHLDEERAARRRIEEHLAHERFFP